MSTYPEKIDNAVHAALCALGISAETHPDLADDLNDFLTNAARDCITDD